MQRPLALLAAVALTGCASNARVAKLETRIKTLEAQLADARHLDELRAAGMDDQVSRASSESQHKLDELAETITQLQATIARLDARPTPPPPPTRPMRPQADPALTYAVPLDDSPAVGPAHAKVTIVKGYEFACPFCEKVRATEDEILKAYGKDVRIVYKAFVVHPQVATFPAQVACAAHKQGKWEEMAEQLWEQAFKTRQFEEAHILDLAQDLKLDMKRLDRDIHGDCVAEVQRDMTELQRFGVGATPSFFINGRFLSGAQPLACFKVVIDEELAKANAAIKGGIKLKNYYDAEVLKKGLPQLATP